MPNTWPIPLYDLISYIVFLFNSRFSYSTIRCYISGISFVLKINDFEDVTQRFVISKLLDGAKRLQGKKLDTRLPITRPLLIDIVRVLPQACNSTFEVKLFTAAFSIAFFGFMRIGEIAVKNGNSNHTILFENIKLMEKTVEIYLASSKNDQFGKGITISITRQSGVICPVQSMNAYFDARPSVKGVCFCHFDTSPLTYYQFSSILKKTLKLLKVDHERILSHSFRIGRATNCAMEGMSDEDIKTLGRWKSNVFKNYIRIPECL